MKWIIFFMPLIVQAAPTSNVELRLEREGRFGSEFLQVERNGVDWVCRGTTMRGNFVKASPLEGWSSVRIRKLESKRPCRRPAKVVLPGEKGPVSTCSDVHSFEELWASIQNRCQYSF